MHGVESGSAWLAGRLMRHNWICYTTHCHSCGHAGLLQVWSDRRGWGYKTSALVVAAVNRIHPENSVMRVRCLCLQSSVVVGQQSNSPGCARYRSCRFMGPPTTSRDPLPRTFLSSVSWRGRGRGADVKKRPLDRSDRRMPLDRRLHHRVIARHLSTRLSGVFSAPVMLYAARDANMWQP